MLRYHETLENRLNERNYFGRIQEGQKHYYNTVCQLKLSISKMEFLH